MSKVKQAKLIKLKDSLLKLKKDDIELGFIKINLDNELNLLYYSIPIIFPNDFKIIGADVIHNKTKNDFYEVIEDYFGLNEFSKYLLFYNESDLDKRIVKYNIEKDNNLRKIKKNIEKILKIL